jgi:hypothetical protein
MFRGIASVLSGCDGLMPSRTATNLVGGQPWHFEYYENDIYGATHFDDARGEWAYVLFAPTRLPGQCSAVDHDSGFREQVEAVAGLRRAARKHL